eukprot:9504012-Pyramimonas_sp.AAC.1
MAMSMRSLPSCCHLRQGSGAASAQPLEPPSALISPPAGRLRLQSGAESAGRPWLDCEALAALLDARPETTQGASRTASWQTRLDDEA